MTVVDYIDLDDDDCYVKVDFVDLSTDEDSVEKDGNVPEDVNVARSENVAKATVSSSISEQDATTTASLSKLQQEHAGTASLLMVEHGATTSSAMAEETMQPEHPKFLATTDVAKEPTRSGNHGLIAASDLVGEAMQSEHEHEDAAFSFSLMSEQASTSLLLINQGVITSSLREGYAIQSGDQVFVTAVDRAKEATQSENTAKAAGSLSITEIGAMGVKGDAGNAMGSTRTYNLHAQEEQEGDSEKNENCDFRAEPEALCQEVSQDVLAMSLPPHDKEKEISQCRKLYVTKGKKQVNTYARALNKQLCIVQSKGVLPTLHNRDSGFSVMGNVCNGTSSMTSQGNAMYGKVRDSGSEGCMVEGCTNVAHGGTPLCVFHNSRPRKRCCAVTGCTKGACCSNQGRTDRCVKHGGGKRCKYDGCGKGAQGKTDFCIAHGGGRRCNFHGCRKSAQGRSDYCIEHGGGRLCKFPGCSVSTTRGSDFCSMHRTSLLSGNNSDHELLPAPAPVHDAKKTEPSKRRNSHSVIEGGTQKRLNTNDYVNTVVETGEEKGRVSICPNILLKEQQTSRRLNSESGLAAGSPSPQLASTSPTMVLRF